MKWINAKENPPEKSGFYFKSYFVSGHEWFGIASYRENVGWEEAIIAEFPTDFPEGIIKDKEFLKEIILYYSEMPSNYPIY